MRSHSLFFVLTFLLTFKISASTNYTLDNLTHLSVIPSAEFKQTIIFNDNTTTIKSESFGNYFYRLDSNRDIKVWNTSDPTFPTLVCTISQPSHIEDFAIDSWNGQFAYVDRSQAVTIIYPNCTVNGSFQVPYTTLNAKVFLSFTFVGIWFSQRNQSERQFNYAFRYRRQNFTLISQQPFWEFSGSNIRLAHCVKPAQLYGISQFFMVYDSRSYVMVYGWQNADSTIPYHQQSSPPINNYNWSIKSAQFDFDCGYIYLTYGAPLNKVSILYHDKTKFLNQISFPVEVYTAVPVDQKKWIMAVFFANNSLLFFNVTDTTKYGEISTIKPMPFLFQQNITIASDQNPFSRSTSLFYVATDQNAQIYRLECPSGIRLGMGLCLDIFDEAVQQNQKFQELKFVFRAIKAMAFVIAFMQITPLAGIFLRFINFWSICSIYSLVQVHTAEPLTSILYEIYMLINASLFNMFGMDFSVSITKEEKVTGKYFSDYQISSNFVGILLEPIVCTCVMSIIFYGFEWIKLKWFSKQGKKVSVSKFKIFFGQYVSFLSVFMFPIIFIYLSLYRYNYQEKLNSAMNILSIGLGLVTPFTMILLNGRKVNTTKKLQNNQMEDQKPPVNIEKQKIKQKKPQYLTFQNIQFGYVCFVNISMPILGTLNNPYWFIIICGLLILLGIVIDSKRKDWRINSIIMNAELMVFHVCFSLHLANFSERGRYTMSVICAVIIMIGAVHEILSVIARLCLNAYLIFVHAKNKVSDEKCQEQLKAKKSTKISLKNRKKETNFAKPNNLTDLSKIKKSTTLVKSKQQPVIRKNVKIEQIIPANTLYREEEKIQQRENIRAIQFKTNFNKQSNSKQQGILNSKEQNLPKENPIKNYPLKPKRILKTRQNPKIKEMNLNIKP